MTYARARLWLGITSVGFWVVASVIALAVDLPNRLFTTPEGGDVNVVAQRMAIIVGMYLLLSFPFDLIGGYVLPRRYGLLANVFPQYILSWLRGALAQGIILFVLGMIIAAAGRQSGNVWLVLVLLFGLMIALVGLQEYIARFVSGFRAVKPDLAPVKEALERYNLNVPDDAVVFRHQDPAFTGGLVGLPGLEKLVLPEGWFKTLTPDQLAVQIARRIGTIRTDSRSWGVYIGIAFNLIGFYFASQAAGRDSVESVAGLFEISLYFTLWSFVGLLTLPSLNRGAVYAADQFARKEGGQVKAIEDTIEILDKQQGEEPQRSALVQTIFHPIPSVESREVQLTRRAATHFGFWQVARTTLYLSWACLGFLSRAVHCNVGKPELWVLYPSD
jgi:hypothetical protein